MINKSESSKPMFAPVRAGAAQVDITPKMGTQLAGDIGKYRPAEMVFEPLYAKALVLESNGKKLCFLSLDLLAITTDWAEKIRRLAAEKYGFEKEAVMVHVVQNHAAPSLGHLMFSSGPSKLIPRELWWLYGGDDNYHPYAVDRILEAIRQADNSLQPVSIGYASGIESRVAFNRRFVMRDGSVRTHPKPDEILDILHAEGPIDPELGVACFTAESLNILAMLLHHTCHPVHGCGQRHVSSGWPGIWADSIQTIHGKQCIPLVINGCCGNIHHANHLDRSYADDYHRLGDLLTETTEQALKGIQYQREAVLDWKVKHIKIPMRKIDPKDIEEARQLLKEHPEPIWRNPEHTAIEWQWVYAVGLIDLDEYLKRNHEFDYEIQVFRAGDLAVVALGGEPFVEGQLRIKMESPAKRTYIAHMANGYVGYIPTRKAFERPGYKTWIGNYETRTSNGSKLVPEALDMIADETIRLLKDVFKK